MRTGSTWLSSILDNHPDIECKQELLHHRRYRGSAAQSASYIQKQFKGEKRLAGFKILYHQFRGPPGRRDTIDKSIFCYIFNEVFRAKIIHIKRNLIDIFLSHQLAKRTKLWNVINYEERTEIISDTVINDVNETLHDYNQPIMLDINQAIRFKDRYGRWRDEIEKMFKDKIDVDYDELPNIAKICDFLGVKREQPKYNTVKLLDKKFAEIIINYEEISKIL